ncbi:MAG: IMP cyclohydrolase / Phosphoribosylaminoimidazolecarboxamide formyltransferase [uncultured Thermomicrobiales bacterium]|uniref:Bifunctional purine biosynthesis protein PurH n=1 Tax=uncultured Thermomicrobiales bacterium TaxID=1645740 RepID=A0A6J4VW04_9BACT|nr:MAG: IMP cyclohydrolase / Phosphoribosylaminoimidazolecarboxamide formyltransferase [uncultured Thermomicrobiales bacterium]
MRALLSVSDKTGVVELGRELVALGWELYSTGNTERALREGGVEVAGIERLTGVPEILDGRVKTLHPAVHGGILARRDRPEHLATLSEHQIGPIDLVVSNLYPFARTVADSNVALEDALEQIDIGGPTLTRAAAKNFPDVLILTDPVDYAPTIALLRQGAVPLAWRRRLAARAFAHVSAYDALIARYLRADLDLSADDELFPREMSLGLEKIQGMRYGENPHQRAAFYRMPAPGAPPAGLATARQLHGKELSYNNIMDADAAWGAATDFAAPCVAIVKHTLPCGLATHDDLAEAYRRALSGDPVSAFGGIVAANRPIDEATAAEIAKTHYDIVLAPDFDPAALTILQKRKNLRLLACGAHARLADRLEVRQVLGGLLVQTPNDLAEDPATWRVVTTAAPTAAQLDDLAFAWRAVKHVKSNAIVIASDRTLRGMGAGQPNRVTSVKLAADRAGEGARGAVLASDAFFPFPDGIEAAATAGVVAIAQPGGSMRDEVCIAAADAAGIAMVFTGVRHFRH